MARASLEELRLDYEDFLRQRGLAQWPPEHPALMRFKAKRCATLEQAGFKALDALHLACAEAGEAERFLTCDDRLIRRYSGRMIVQTPVTFTAGLT